MPNELEAYQDALTAVQRHSEYVQQILRLVHRLSSAAANGGWRRITIPQVSMLAETGGPGSTSFESGSWPTGDQIRDAILKWDELIRRQRAAWQQVSPDRRTGLTPPT